MVPGVTSPAMSLNHFNKSSSRARSFKFVPVQGKHVSPNLQEVGNKSFNPATVKLFGTCLANREIEGNVRVLVGTKRVSECEKDLLTPFQGLLGLWWSCNCQKRREEGIPNLKPRAKYFKHSCPSFETGYCSHSVYTETFYLGPNLALMDVDIHFCIDPISFFFPSVALPQPIGVKLPSAATKKACAFRTLMFR